MTTTAIAENSVKKAAGVAYFVAAVTALLAVLAWLDVFYLLTPWSLLDAALFAIIAFFISRGSRAAAIMGLALYLVEAVDRIVSGIGSSSSGIVLVIFSLFFINGIRGSYALVRFRNSSQDMAPAAELP